ncbi:MAG TPA: low-specificity L-threonine aldolase [Acidimicrobiales bacterium]|nr:low-specificity L-threonine aldolase [Acidimicrobiales bacterium]MDP7208253.1 low-specificity L-threonine aldolase [Acidimicrobiales bacterium]HJL90624.1 low-specificity L-threonine aldolase [Acidimicrobiales bacterium]HJP00083.1 low-specificity L-threonine aldolase [Acidimicrobiales bacterium]
MSEQVPTLADFRSDTVTRATPGMRAAIAAADVGDDVYGEDPTVNALQDRMADLTGKEAALFFPAATQSNLAAVLSHCQRGDEYLIGRNYHILTDEASGTAALGGAVPWPIETDEGGSLTAEAVREAVKEPDQHHPVTRLLCLENTVHGSPQPVDLIDDLTATARDCGLSVHLDGARLFNAATALNVPVANIIQNVDTASICLSKGLGAPMGAVLVGDGDSIARAFRLRKMLGGGMRQVGHMAAACMYALDHHVDRLIKDHENAALIADGFRRIDGLRVRQATNMVWLTPPAEHHDALAAHLAADGLLLWPWKPTIRIVTHLDVDVGQARLLVDAVQRFFNNL